MKYSNISRVVVIFVLSVMTTNGTLFAKSNALQKKKFRPDVIGIATSSGNTQRIEVKLLKLQTDARSFSSVDKVVSKYKKEIESK